MGIRTQPQCTTHDKEAVLYRHAGERIRERRKMLRMTQGQLAQSLSVTYQQIQKYETGLNQLSLAKLLKLARILNVSPDYFYRDITLSEVIGEEIQSDIITHARTDPLQVVLVEDNMADMLLFKRATEPFERDMRAHWINDAEMLMDYLRNHFIKYGNASPDLIVLNFNLSRRDGMDLLKEIKNNSATCILPVLVMASRVSRKQMREGYRIGVASFVHKPANFEEYSAMIETMIRYWSKIAISQWQ